MCKIFSMTNMSKVAFTPKLIDVIKKEVCGYGDKDGFGYAVLTDTGNLFGERTISPQWFEPFMNGGKKSKIDMLPLTAKNGDMFGKLRGMPKSMIAHGRLSTNTVSIANTHPFVGEGIAMVHNGVIQDAGQMLNTTDLKTNNDTEIAFRYWQLGGMKDVEENVSGYYALAVLDQQKKLLHIVKDDSARLFVVYCPTIDSYMFATTSEILKGIAKKMKWKLEEIRPVLNNIYGVFDRNECVEYRTIEPLGHQAYTGYSGWKGSETSLSAESKALGFDVTSPENEPIPYHKEYSDESKDATDYDAYWDKVGERNDDGPMATDDFMAVNHAIIRKLKG